MEALNPPLSIIKYGLAWKLKVWKLCRLKRSLVYLATVVRSGGKNVAPKRTPVLQYSVRQYF